MTELTEAYVDSFALNAGAIKNGKDLVRKNSFQKLARTEDGTLLFGECKGSGKEPYSCSADFLKAEQPIFRCSCPSRQFPCKHILGLMHAYVDGKTFDIADIPSDIADKREKADKREEKKKETAAAPEGKESKRKVNKNALAKKLASQLEGIELAHKLIQQMVQAGLASLDMRSIRMYEDQAKQLGNHYVPGVQATLREVFVLINTSDNHEAIYTEAFEQLASLHALLKRSRDYIKARIEDPDLPMDITSNLEEKIGHAWQLSELRELELIRRDVELVQLNFRSYTDEARGEYVDEGHWLQLHDGEIVVTRNYRPFRAAKHIKEEDSVYMAVQTKELFTYPGDLNKRVRWEEMTMRELNDADRKNIRSFAERSSAAAVKAVKNHIKTPLADKNPVMLLHAAEVAKTENGCVLIDDQGGRLPLSNISRIGHPTLQLLPHLNHEQIKNTAVLVMFEDHLSEGKLTAQPLTLITENEMIRLYY
ncbi:SWIM zinc finger family protein [Paenibacillus sp. LHD-38]|uniref:SWIM zinc finger family protein n=1 Tax=Paenibacillus sp. LHD-38 TaxID=3072143 RepID=UPI00280FE2C6|nr:SWIM zinc finger family protein [Paenibacillus sp. LHD-38]MDQ8733658.1 SWIM zinc finger family protein [Paenibacillus sp. LHD-38]